MEARPGAGLGAVLPSQFLVCVAGNNCRADSTGGKEILRCAIPYFIASFVLLILEHRFAHMGLFVNRAGEEMTHYEQGAGVVSSCAPQPGNLFVSCVRACFPLLPPPQPTSYRALLGPMDSG